MDRRFAWLAAQFVNIFRDPRQHPDPYTADDFMKGNEGAGRRDLTPEEMLEKVKLLHAAYGRRKGG